MSFGKNPIEGKFAYKAFYADIPSFDAETYGRYAMLVRDFYASDIQAKFNELFPGLDHASVQATIHNPNAYMEAHRPVVERLIAKYRDTTSPLEFYGSKHMAEGIAMLIECLTHPELKGAILADEQGMAKTIQAIIAVLEAGLKRVFVVAPKTARATSWPSELKKVSKDLSWKFGNPQAPGSRNVQFELYTWDDLRRMPSMAEIFELEDAQRKNGVITPRGQARLEELRRSVGEWASKFDVILADEAHRAKHEDSQRSTALRNISAHVPRIIPMTGTPITKYPKNVLHLLKLVRHPLAANPRAFMARYNPETGGWGGKQTVSKQRLEELHALLRDCYIRREKTQTNLPPKVRYVQKIELSEKELEAIDERWEAYCDGVDKDGVKRRDKMAKPTYPIDLVHTMKIREFLSSGKVEAVSEWAEDLLEADEKVVIFTCFKETFDAYMARFKKWGAVGIDGGVATDMRTRVQEAFQKNPKTKVFIGNVQAAGESITLTAAAHLGMNDLPWLPTETLQAEDRIARGGQTRPCEIRFFLANHEKDEDGFKDFLQSKGVVQTVTNRRDEKGEIKDAAWAGELEGTGVKELALDQGQTGGEFDWEDAGEEPPVDEIEDQSRAQKSRDFVDRIVQRRLSDQARKAGTLFGDAKKERVNPLNVLKESLPSGRAGDAIIQDELSQLRSYLLKWDLEFANSIIGWIGRGKNLSPKQRNVAMKIIAKNRKHLLGRS